MIINIQQEYEKLIISRFNEKGSVSTLEIPVPANEKYEWYYTNGNRKDSRILSWDNKNVIKKKSRFLSKWRIEEFLHDQPQHIKNLLFDTFNKPKIFFCDIEVEIDETGFPDPKKALKPITLITFSYNEKLIAMGTKPLTQNDILGIRKDIQTHFNDESIEFNYIKFDSEYDLLYTFLAKYMKKMGFITGWNFVGMGAFDWPYILTRCKHLGIDPGISSIAVTEDDKKLVGKDKIPLHKVMVDYMAIYKKWDKSVKVKESNSLQYVSKVVLGIEKIKYNGSLQDLYETDFRRYVFYGSVDSRLVQLIHQKLETVQVFLSLAHITGVEAQKTFSPIAMTEAVMAREFYKRGKVFPKVFDKKQREKYEGAIVFKPTTGLHRALAAFDFASLYPTIIRQWNISIENYVENTDKEVERGKFIKTSSGAVFSNNEDSVFRGILGKYYGMRKERKNEMFEIDKEITYLKKLLK